MADSNPANFANLPKDELREIAAKGGHASHGANNKAEVRHPTSSFVTYVPNQHYRITQTATPMVHSPRALSSPRSSVPRAAR